MTTPIFPKWTNAIRPAIAVTAVGAPLYLLVLLNWGFSPQTLDVGYQPVQPVPYSHLLHAGELGIDCRYCHSTVEQAGHAAIPPTSTCMNCHTQIWQTSPKLEPVRESYRTGLPIKWIKVHDLPDYAYFNHSVHLKAGVGCVTCHGRIDRMEVVYQSQPLSMAWCLDCHRRPDGNLRDPSQITNMTWTPPAGKSAEAFGAERRKQTSINPSQDCSTCHR